MSCGLKKLKRGKKKTNNKITKKKNGMTVICYTIKKELSKLDLKKMILITVIYEILFIDLNNYNQTLKQTK